MKFTFNEWLNAKNIDCQTLESDMLQTLQRQFDQEQQRHAPVAERLVEPSDCLHPRRAYRVAVVIADAAAAGLVLTRACDMGQ